MNDNFSESQDGSINVLLIPLILSVVLLLGSLGFGAWAYASRQDYKANSDQKSEAAVAVAVEKTKSEKDNEFLQKEKEPYKTYTSPVQFGSFSLKYPKTWSAYSNEATDQHMVLMQPDYVSSKNGTAYAIKVEVVGSPYNQVISRLDNDIKQGRLKATSITLAKMPNIVGLRVDGQVANDKTGAAVYLPLREKTIRVVTESPDKVADFNNIILPSFEFIP